MNMGKFFKKGFFKKKEYFNNIIEIETFMVCQSLLKGRNFARKLFIMTDFPKFEKNSFLECFLIKNAIFTHY